MWKARATASGQRRTPDLRLQTTALAGGRPQIGVNNKADDYVARIVQSRTLFSRVPVDLEETRAAIAQILGGPSASKSVSPPGVLPGEDLIYTLAYAHSGQDAVLVVTDFVPALTPIIAVTGPGTIQRAGQDIRWEVPVSTGDSVTLTIQAIAATVTGPAINTATFSSTQILTREAKVLIYESRLYLPVITRLY